MPIQVDNSPLKIKLITDPGEIEVYSDLITRHHYLGSSQVNRNTIVHVARRGRHDVAVLTWERNVRRWFGMRDRLIGWTKSQKNNDVTTALRLESQKLSGSSIRRRSSVVTV
jgi:hypothetical protein